MLNRDLYNIKNGIEKCKDLVNVADITFTMAVARLDNEVSSELRIIEKGRKQYPEEYKEYTKKKEELDFEFAIKKEDGTLQTIGNNLLIRNPMQYYAKLDELNKEYDMTLKAVKAINDEFDDFLDKENPKQFTKISQKCIPAIISVEQAKLLFPAISM